MLLFLMRRRNKLTWTKAVQVKLFLNFLLVVGGECDSDGKMGIMVRMGSMKNGDFGDGKWKMENGKWKMENGKPARAGACLST